MVRRRHHAPWVSPPTLDDLAAIAEAALADLPAPFRAAVDGVAIRVADFPDAATERQMGLETPFDLLGLYHGVSIDRKESAATPHDVDQVFLYRRPILDYWAESGESLADIVRHVLIHEIGHHLGYSDADMHAIEDQA
jgi:predicted Zn-dependent protease with MMP-like domain